MRINDTTKGNVDKIIQYLELKVCNEPPEPFLLAGVLIQDLKMRPSDFYIAIGHVLDYKVGEYREGKRKYYYLLDMVKRHQNYLKNRRG